MELLGHILDFVGKVMVSYTAIAVHHRFWKEHKIDDQVFDSMKKERIVGLLGIVFMLLGFVLELPFKL